MSSDLLSALSRNGSGLNLRDLARTLTQAETAPKMDAIRNRMTRDEQRMTALGQVRAQFDALGQAMAQAASNPIMTVSTTSAGVLPRVTDRQRMSPETLPIDVQRLAKRQVLEFGGLSSLTTPVEAGRLRVEFGEWGEGAAFDADPARQSITLDIRPGTTLADLARSLSSLPGITARALDKGDGTVSLGIVSETGASNAIRLSVDQASGGEGMPLSSFDMSGGPGARQVQAATDALVLVDGIAVTRPDNLIRDVMPGVDVTLSATGPAMLSIEREEGAARANVQTLIDGLNGVLSLMQSLTQRGVGGGVAGPLAGDRAMESLQSQIRSLLAAPLNGFGDRPIFLADLGIATERNGQLRFDPPAFDRTFRLSPARFDALFGDVLTSLTPGLSVRGNPSRALQSGDLDFRTDAAGNATLAGNRMLGLDLGQGRMVQIALTGPVEGLSIMAEPGVTTGTLRFGRSLVGSLAQMIDQARSGNGNLGRREADLTRASQSGSEQIAALEARAALIEKRYLTRFAAMEQAVTQMNGTGQYLKNLQDMWSRDR